MSKPLPTELVVLAASLVLFFAQIVIQGASALREQGVTFNAGPRDETPVLGPLAGRGRRALENLKEAMFFFVPLALGLAVTGRGGGIADVGAWTWLAARVVYVPLYLAGVPWWRTLAWGISTIGLILMFARLV